MYEHETPTDPLCVKIRTGFVINFTNFPVLCQQKLQSDTSLYNMWDKVSALDHSCNDFFPIVNIDKYFSGAVGMTIGDTTMNVSMHEDNTGALVFVDTLPPQFTNQSKYYNSKTIWFQEKINKHKIRLVKIDTLEQLTDIFKKGIRRVSL